MSYYMVVSHMAGHSSQGRPHSSQGRPASASGTDSKPKGFVDPQLAGGFACMFDWLFITAEFL